MQPRLTDPTLFAEPSAVALESVALVTLQATELVPFAEPHATEPIAAPRRWHERLRESPWFPILGKGIAITAVMLGFSALGAVSMATTEPGVHVAAQLMPGAPIEWLAPTPGQTPPTPTPPTPTPPAPTSAPSSTETAPLGSAQRARPLKAVLTCGERGSLCEDQKQPPEGVTSDGKVILNVANAEVLTQLPGVGARRAEAIIELRARLKRFRKASDLLRVRGIGVRSLKRMLPHLVLDPPKPETSQPGAPTPPSEPKPP